jgi:Ca2+-binding EF-hand superfamily protein
MADSGTKIYQQFQRRQLARGFAARNPVVVEKKLNVLQNHVREKLIAIGAPTYKTIFEFAGKPTLINATIFHRILQRLDLRIDVHDAKLLLRSMTGGRSTLSFHEFCRAVTQDQTKNWEQMRNSFEKPADLIFCTDISGSNKRLRPEYRDERLHQQQEHAASNFGRFNLQKKGIEVLVEQQLKERTRHAHERTLLIKKIFQPILDRESGHRLVRATNFEQGIRRLGILVTNAQLKACMRLYKIMVIRNGKSTNLINLSTFLKNGLGLPNAKESPAGKITKRKLINTSGLPNRGIPDDYGIRRIQTPTLKPLILQKINERSRPGGGMCLEAFKMFAPGKAKGAITPRYFNQRLKDYGLILNQHRSDMLLQEVDVDGGGDVSFNEFAEHFLPKGIHEGSLTDKLAQGSMNKKNKNKRLTKKEKDATMNMTLKPLDRAFVRKNFPDPEDEHQHADQFVQINKKDDVEVGETEKWMSILPSPLRQRRTPPLSNSGRAMIEAVALSPSTFRSRQYSRSTNSLLQSPIRASSVLRRAALSQDHDGKKEKPWWAQNRQPSRLNWRRLRVEHAAGTITGSYSQCSLRKGAEKFV